MAAQDEPSRELRAKLAFGLPLREGVELSHKSGLGLTAVLGCGPCHQHLFTAGEPTDQLLSPAILLRAAEDGGAVVLDAGWTRIIWRRVALDRVLEIVRSAHPVLVVESGQQTTTLLEGKQHYLLRGRSELRNEANNLVNALRLLGATRQKPLGRSADDNGLAHTMVEDLSGHLSELGESGHALRVEGSRLAAMLDLPWPPPNTLLGVGLSREPDRTGEASRARPFLEVHNESSGTAHNVVQAGSIGSVVIAAGPPPVRPPRLLPFAARDLVNQKAVLARLSAMISADVPAVHCVVGTAGVGKSAVVVHWAAAHESQFPDGVLFADLRGFHPVGRRAEPGEILDVFLTALGSPEQAAGPSLQSRIAAYRTAMHSRRMLVVLDDAGTEEQVRPLLPRGRNAVVVTSRSALRGLAAKEGAEVIFLDLLPPQEAVELLGRIAGPELAPVGPRTAELARLCGCLPLALRIAGERLASGDYVDIDEFIDELSDDGVVLDLLDTGDPASALRSVFATSYRHLDGEQARVFRFFGLFAGTTAGAEAAAALAGLPVARARRALASLRLANLLEFDGPRRFRMHDLLRHFAVERVEQEDGEDAKDAAIRSLTAWYLATTTNADKLLDSARPGTPPIGEAGLDFPNAAASDEWLSVEQTNLVACVRQAAARGHDDLAWRLAATLFEHFYRAKAWDDWIDTQTAGLASARRARDRRGTAELLGKVGVAYRERGEHDRAEECFREALDAWTKLGDDEGVAWVAGRYAQGCRELGRLDEAVRLCHQALEAARRTGNRRQAGVLHNNLSGIHRDAGRLDEALEHSSLALAAFEAVGYRRGEAWARTNAANTHRDAGRLTEAMRLYEQAHDERKRLADHYGRALTLSDMGYAQCLAGEVETGLATLRSSLDSFPENDPMAARARARIAEFER
ncbi:MAG: tetratricopeptide repeat protein [Actinomycetota bacterium]|nr:tetratricopeptide repeat protein [Actinomycetota bacterium]